MIRHPGSRYSAGSLSQILGFRGVTPLRIPPSAPAARSRGASGGGPVERCMGEAPLSTAVLGQTLCVERWRTVPTSNPPHSAQPLGGTGSCPRFPRGGSLCLGGSQPHRACEPYASTQGARETGSVDYRPPSPEGPGERADGTTRCDRPGRYQGPATPRGVTLKRKRKSHT